MQIEHRSLELRSELTGRKLAGYAAVFNTRADIGPYWEQFRPTAFDAALSRQDVDVRAFSDHDPGKLLGRQSAGTLRLSTDSTGLHFELDLPDTTVGRDVRTLVERGDLTGVSIGFVAGQEEWSDYGDRDLRTHIAVAKLIEISPVSIPAYAETSIALRRKPKTNIREQLVRARARTL